MKFSQIIYILLLTSLFSCSKMLEEEPKGMINESFLSTEDGLKNLVLSQYYQSRLIVEDLRHLGEFPSDLMTKSLNSDEINNIVDLNVNVMPTLGAYTQSWRNLYSSINNINFGLKVIQEKDDQSLNTMKGELSFLRAWFYLLIVETWGTGAHYTVEPTTTVLTEGNQTTIDVFYTLILNDLNEAISSLPESSAESGRITIPAAKSLKARALLALAGYDTQIIIKSGIPSKQSLYSEVKKLADEVINNYSFKLLPDYKAIFDTYNQGNDEVIWAVQFSGLEKFNTSGLSTGGHGLHRYWVGNYNKSARTQA